MTHEELELYVKAVTDRLTVLDQIIKSEKLGQPKVMAFRCTHSGLYYPANYVKEWGKTTGIGLGSSVVSESLDSQYHLAPEMTRVKRIEDIMHPLEHSFAQVDMVTIPEEEFLANQLILANDDPSMERRAAICRGKQLQKGGRVALLQSEFARVMGRKVGAN